MTEFFLSHELIVIISFGSLAVQISHHTSVPHRRPTVKFPHHSSFIKIRENLLKFYLLLNIALAPTLSGLDSWVLLSKSNFLVYFSQPNSSLILPTSTSGLRLNFKFFVLSSGWAGITHADEMALWRPLTFNTPFWNSYSEIHYACSIETFF